ncbi:MAG: Ltp family lipoprotein [Eubacterium sp.]|nr:Ltp family lipoprotein [Eubacterium sp.]
MKKIVSILIVVTLIFGCLTTLPCNTYAKTKKWKTYLGLNKGWYEGAGGTIKTSKRGFTANLSKQIGWGGVWGGQAWYNYNFKKGHKYKISFKIKSTKIKKYVYIKVGIGEKKTVVGKWVDCKKGKWKKVKITFRAKRKGSFVAFGFGGDYGDRKGVSTDKDAAYRYSIAPKKRLDGRLGIDSSVFTTKILVRKFKIRKDSQIYRDYSNSYKWKRQALKRARYYMSHGNGMSKRMLYKKLKKDGFSKKAIKYAIKYC